MTPIVLAEAALADGPHQVGVDRPALGLEERERLPVDAMLRASGGHLHQGVIRRVSLTQGELLVKTRDRVVMRWSYTCGKGSSIRIVESAQF
jgi:hypothetical protein